MAETTILLFMYVDICILFGFYLYLRRIKKLIGFQLGMNISIVMGGMIALLFWSITHTPISLSFHFDYDYLHTGRITGWSIVWTVIRLPNVCHWLNEWNSRWVDVTNDRNSYRNAIVVCLVHSRLFCFKFMHYFYFNKKVVM